MVLIYIDIYVHVHALGRHRPHSELIAHALGRGTLRTPRLCLLLKDRFESRVSPRAFFREHALNPVDVVVGRLEIG